MIVGFASGLLLLMQIVLSVRGEGELKSKLEYISWVKRKLLGNIYYRNT